MEFSLASTMIRRFAGFKADEERLTKPLGWRILSCKPSLRNERGRGAVWARLVAIGEAKVGDAGFVFLKGANAVRWE